VNNREQFAADPFGGAPQGSLKHLRVHVQRRIDVGVSYELRDQLTGYALVVTPRRVGTPKGQPCRVRQP